MSLEPCPDRIIPALDATATVAADQREADYGKQDAQLYDHRGKAYGGTE